MRWTVKGKHTYLSKSIVILNLKHACSKSSLFGKNSRYISEDEFEFPKLLPIRA